MPVTGSGSGPPPGFLDLNQELDQRQASTVFYLHACKVSTSDILYFLRYCLTKESVTVTYNHTASHPPN